MAQKKPAVVEKRAVLYLVAGGAGSEAVKLRRDATIIGREKGDILVEDHEVSSTHCQIQNINDVYHVFDMNSTNGTFVNKERIVKAKLQPGDVISVGGTSFRFALEDERNVRHIATIFKSTRSGGDSRSGSTVVDTLIESELRNSQHFAIRVKVNYPDGTEESVEMKQKLLYVGRASSFGKFDQDAEISRKHLLVKLNDSGQVFIEDQGSTNGVFLNNVKIKGMHPVQPNDEVRIGSCRLRIAARRI